MTDISSVNISTNFSYNLLKVDPKESKLRLGKYRRFISVNKYALEESIVMKRHPSKLLQ